MNRGHPCTRYTGSVHSRNSYPDTVHVWMDAIADRAESAPRFKPLTVTPKPAGQNEPFANFWRSRILLMQGLAAFSAGIILYSQAP